MVSSASSIHDLQDTQLLNRRVVNDGSASVCVVVIIQATGDGWMSDGGRDVDEE